MVDKLEIPSVLAFERKLDPSDALFYSGSWNDWAIRENWRAVQVKEKSVRGVISNRLKAKEQDSAKLDAQIDKPNLQKVDVAILPHDCDTLKVTFTLRILGNIGCPSVCNNEQYRAKISEVVDEYAKSGGFFELARRYAYNLASGRFLWRNRICAEQVAVYVELLKNGEPEQLWKFDDALVFSLNKSSFVPEQSQASQVGALAKVIESALTHDGCTILNIMAFAQMGKGQEVFPSQELVLDKDTSRGKKSKILYRVDEIAAMHSQKIGNAIRTIDSWYSDQDNLEPIAIEPYGSVTTQGRAFRKPKDHLDFYTLLDGWILGNKVPTKEQQGFVVAMLIRGGVFGKAEDKAEQT